MLTASFLSIALAASLLTLPPTPVPVGGFDAPEIPRVSAERWIVYDASTDTLLASWNADDRAPMASVTKVMTAMIVLEHADPVTVITIPSFATNARGSSAGLIAGERWSIADLLLAMLIRSGNDAALVLAYHVGGNSVSGFVTMMNAEAARLGMADTRFANPSGLDADGQYSSARDLLTLTIASQQYPDIQRIGQTRLVKLPATPHRTSHTFENTNQMLGAFPGAFGLKTGDTPQAEKVLLATSQRAGRIIYSVVMHSDDHFADTRELLEWSYSTLTLRDRWLRPLARQADGGAISGVFGDLSRSEQRRLQAMPALDNGQWRTSKLEDLPKAAIIGRWIREVIPNVASGE